MKFSALAIIATLIATPALANKLHQEQPTASEVKAWEADQAKIKKQEAKKKKHQKHKQASSAASTQSKKNIGKREDSSK
ncbi:hypothetical protein [Aquitalea sp. LB_tupeE]|uniref:hypothetical protein n=1 Tax=Aquitalea sp. LB_tupeE TaxID=2748078 RepID=UPI0015C06B80|nr:hypothetical protein [Aquitalea sp. LB_tupeE]NWK79886.1 hypothetical protein [Aquitalea sp. LB_tupeE]